MEHSKQPPNRDFDRWQYDVERLCGLFATAKPTDAQTFVGDITHTNAGAMAIIDVATNAHMIERNQRHISRDPNACCFLMLMMAGNTHVSQDNATTHLHSGDLVLLDARRPVKIAPQGMERHLSFHLPCDIVDRTLRHRKWLAANPIRATTVNARLLRYLLIEAYQRTTELTEPESLGLRDAIMALLAPTFHPELPYHSLAAIYHRACTVIDHDLSNTELCPTDIACSVGVSLRQLHRAFAAHQDSVSLHVQTHRLAHIADDIANPAYASRSLTEIALFWGMNDLAYFSRIFRQRYACTPREWRQRATLSVETPPL